MIKLLEFFGGIAQPRKAWLNIGVDVKSIDYVEILPSAVAACNQMFDNSYKVQDINDWNRDVDLVFHGSPCQDWSNNGNNDVSTGRSIQYMRTLDILENILFPKAKVVIWENVTGLISKKHISHFNHYLETMEKLGYTNSYRVLNAKDFNLPQHRERVFVVSILGNQEFKFPEPVKLQKRLLDYIDVDEDSPELQLTANELSLFYWEDDRLFIKENTKKGFREVFDGDSVNVERPTSKTRRGRVGSQIVKTITTSNNHVIFTKGKLRKLSLREVWRLMGYTDKDYDSVIAVNIPKTDMQLLAGNSIAAPVLEAIYTELLKQVFTDIKQNLKEETV